MRALLAACAFLFAGTSALAALPYGHYWIWTVTNDHIGNGCARDAQGQCKLYASGMDACTDMA